MALKSAGDPVTYQAPAEGAMAWVGGMSIPINAENTDEIYAFIDFTYKAANVGPAIARHGYNSPVLVAEANTGDSYKKNFAEAYPGPALRNLNP